MSDLVGNLKDRLSLDAAQITLTRHVMADTGPVLPGVSLQPYSNSPENKCIHYINNSQTDIRIIFC